MKTLPLNRPLTRRPSAIVSALIALFLVLVVSGTPATQNPNLPSQLSLSPTDDGFDGAFTFEGKLHPIENRVKKGFFRTLIADSERRVIIRASFKDDLISIALPTGIIRVDTAKPKQFSKAEIQALEAFIYSNDAALIRRIVYEVRNERITEKRPLLIGFQIIAMFLGDGDVTIASSEKAIDRTKLTFKMANYNCPPPTTNGNLKKRVCNESNCCGCCGAGCWGCSGCWLQSCKDHDECVDSQGYFSPTCMQLLAIAAADVLKYCGGIILE